MTTEDRGIVEEFKKRLPAEVTVHIRRLILYGSRARGDSEPDSDLDLLALVDTLTPELHRTMDDTAYAVMWDHAFQPMISLKVMPEERFNDMLARGFSFYRNVTREGIPA
jgi:predicted nucleotidyltransferase